MFAFGLFTGGSGQARSHEVLGLTDRQEGIGRVAARSHLVGVLLRYGSTTHHDQCVAVDVSDRLDDLGQVLHGRTQ